MIGIVLILLSNNSPVVLGNPSGESRMARTTKTGVLNSQILDVRKNKKTLPSSFLGLYSVPVNKRIGRLVPADKWEVFDLQKPSGHHEIKMPASEVGMHNVSRNRIILFQRVEFEGRVTDQNGKPVSNALVTVLSPGPVNSVRTKQNGNFLIKSGRNIRLRVSATGYRAKIVSNFRHGVSIQIQKLPPRPTPPPPTKPPPTKPPPTKQPPPKSTPTPGAPRISTPTPTPLGLTATPTPTPIPTLTPQESTPTTTTTTESSTPTPTSTSDTTTTGVLPFETPADTQAQIELRQSETGPDLSGDRETKSVIPYRFYAFIGLTAVGLLFVGLTILATAALMLRKYGRVPKTEIPVDKIIIPIGGSFGQNEDQVHCTLYSQREVLEGSDCLVQVFAHLLEQSDNLGELARELDPEARKQLSRALREKIRLNSILTFKLVIPGIDVFENEQDGKWQGEPLPIEFIIPIPENHGEGSRFGRVFVFKNGEEVGKIPFRIKVVARGKQIAPENSQPSFAGEMTQNESAFVSYASEDKDKVYRFVQLMDVLKYDYHIDIFHIDAGDRWARKLYEFIDTDEVFLLFWSQAASQSEWVMKEAKRAEEKTGKERKGPPRIVIYHLENPPVEVPEWLRDIQCDRKWAEIIGKIDI